MYKDRFYRSYTSTYQEKVIFFFFWWHYVFDFHYRVAWNISFLFLVFSLTFPASRFLQIFIQINKFFFKSGQECHFLSRTSPKSGQECPLSNPRDRKWHSCPDLKKTSQISAKILLKCTVSKKKIYISIVAVKTHPALGQLSFILPLWLESLFSRLRW